MMNKEEQPIGFMDSGVGGLSVLKAALEILPNENYIYYGDSKNAPYGVKPLEEVRELTFNIVEELLNRGVKAIVVACNTATSAAVARLRKKYPEVPIIGIEPAIKPAVMLKREGKIIIMATPMTLKQKKFNNLMDKYKDQGEIVPLPCDGLMEFIEKGILEGPELNRYLYKKLEPYLSEKIAAVVLGCTHYPFARQEIANVVGKEVPIIDGSEGTVRELKRRLDEKGLLNKKDNKSKVYVYNSLENNEIIDLSYSLINVERQL